LRNVGTTGTRAIRPCGQVKALQGIRPSSSPHPRPDPCGGTNSGSNPAERKRARLATPQRAVQTEIFKTLARTGAAGGVANRICGNKARAGGGRPGHLGHETLTRGVAIGVMDGVLGAGSPAAIRFRRGTKTWATHIPTSHNPQPLGVILKKNN